MLFHQPKFCCWKELLSEGSILEWCSTNRCGDLYLPSIPKEITTWAKPVLTFTPAYFPSDWQGREYLNFLGLSDWLVASVTKCGGIDCGAFGANHVFWKQTLFHTVCWKVITAVGLRAVRIRVLKMLLQIQARQSYGRISWEVWLSS